MSWQFLEKIISWVFFTTLVCYSDHSTAWGASSLAQQPPMQQHGKPSRTLLCAERQQPSRLCCPRPSADSSDGLTANLWLVGLEGGGRVALLCGATEYSLLCIAVCIYIYIHLLFYSRCDLGHWYYFYHVHLHGLAKEGRREWETPKH